MTAVKINYDSYQYLMTWCKQLFLQGLESCEKKGLEQDTADQSKYKHQYSFRNPLFHTFRVHYQNHVSDTKANLYAEYSNYI